MAIPLSSLFVDEGFERNLDVEERSAHKNQLLLDAINKEAIRIAIKTEQGSKKRRLDGIESAQKKDELKGFSIRNKKIAARYHELLKTHAEHEIAGILAREFDLSKSQIYRIPKPHK